MSKEDTQEQDLAEERTNWAEDRTLMANERTFSSWVGTGLGCLGLAIGMQAVFGKIEPTWIAKAVATIFVVASIFVFQSALQNSSRAMKRLDSHSAEPASRVHLKYITYFLCVGSVCTGIILWLL